MIVTEFIKAATGIAIISGKLKRLIRPTLGFQSMRTARATIKGFEVMRMFKKGQFKLWIEAVGSRSEARFIDRLFGLYT